jgi:hypothetical protein
MAPKPQLLTPFEVDRLLRYAFGRSEQLARDGVLPHVELPCGSIRFRAEEINRFIAGPVSADPWREVARAN